MSTSRRAGYRLDPLPNDWTGFPSGIFARSEPEAESADQSTLRATRASGAKFALGALATFEHAGKLYPASIPDAWGFIHLFGDWRLGDPRIVYRAHQVVAPDVERNHRQFAQRMRAAAA
jgi:hypothetical protein